MSTMGEPVEYFVTLFPSGEWGVSSMESKVTIYKSLPSLLRAVGVGIAEDMPRINRLHIVLQQI